MCQQHNIHLKFVTIHTRSLLFNFPLVFYLILLSFFLLFILVQNIFSIGILFLFSSFVRCGMVVKLQSEKFSICILDSLRRSVNACGDVSLVGRLVGWPLFVSFFLYSSILYLVECEKRLMTQLQGYHKEAAHFHTGL